MKSSQRTIQDSYELLEKLGEGGMADVYKAKQNSLGRIVAVKEIKPAFAAHPELAERFKREAKTAAGIVHQNIVQVYNFGEPKKGGLFIVMEYVEGQDLKTLLAQAGPVPPMIAALIGHEVSQALAYAHERGLVHRDVKPGNIMISSRAEVKLMDFGIVRERDSDLTKTGAFLGTPSYMSPEQLLGDEVNPPSDIFSLGVVLYEILAGEKPFKADSDSTLSKKVRTEKQKKLRSLNREVPRRLQAVVNKCMNKKPEKRFQGGEELARALQKCMGSRSRDEFRGEIKWWLEQADVGEETMPVRDFMVEREPDTDEPAAEEGETRAIAGRKTGAGSKSKQAAASPEKSGARTRTSSGKKAESEKKQKEDPKPVASAPKAAAKSKSEKQEEKEESSSGEILLKWLWRFILLAIAVLAAVIVFLVVEPGQKGEDTSPWKKIIELVVPDKGPPEETGNP
ncbi:MAG: serine/threonine-protein kinase [bacterium]